MLVYPHLMFSSASPCSTGQDALRLHRVATSPVARRCHPLCSHPAPTATARAFCHWLDFGVLSIRAIAFCLSCSNSSSEKPWLA